jgi:hypothetical protein
VGFLAILIVRNALVVDALEKLPENSLTRLDQELADLIKQMHLLDRSAANEPLSNLV